MISIQYSQIPSYLQKGAFYRNLIDSDGDEEIQIPEICYSPDDTVDSLEKLQSTLQIAAFWLLDTIPTGVIKYCYENDFRLWYDAIVSKFGQKVQQFGPFAHKEDIELAFVHTLCSIFNSNSYHHAFQQAVEKNVDEVIDFLIQNSDGNKTVECGRIVAYSGRLDILKRLQQNGFPWSSSACQAAAAKGHLDCLQYLHENGCPWDGELYMDASEIRCVQYAFEQGLPWHPTVAVAFAKRGSVECLQYAIDHGCVLDKAAVKGAARNGHLSTLQLLHDHGCEWDRDVYFEATGDRAHFNIVKYAFENHLEWHPDTCARLAGKNRLEILKYAVQRDCPLSAHAATLCATHGYAECLRCLLEADCPLELDVCKRACMSGKLECLQLLVEHGGVCDLVTARAAAQYRSWKCLKYLCEQGCLVDHTIPLEAVKNGEVDALRCAMDNGCSYADDIVFEAAASERNAYASLKYLIDDQGLALNQDGSLFVAAFARGDFECVQYLIDVGYDVSTCGANLWQPYLLEHVKYTHYYKQLMDKLDKGLLECIEYAVTHAWSIQTCGILLLKHVKTYPDKYPLCHAFLQSESLYYV